MVVRVEYFDWSIFTRRDTISLTATHVIYPPDWAQFLLCCQSKSQVCFDKSRKQLTEQSLQWAKEVRGPSGALVSHPCPIFLPVFSHCHSSLLSHCCHPPSTREDEALQQLYLAQPPGREGRTWTTLAKAMSARSGKQCRDRW